MIGIIGLGFVGGAMFKSFSEKGVSIVGYDKYKNGGIGNLEGVLNCDIVFLCLPTLFNEELKEYNKGPINEVCLALEKNKYKGVVVVKSTIEPETINKLSKKYNLKLCHNPEFLTARTAYEDFHNQKHIVLGSGLNTTIQDMDSVKKFYKMYYPEASISVCTSLESESMKIMCNSFYASKVMLFNEYYLLCSKNGANYDVIKNLMLKNNWINSMHTNVPGPDGSLGYGGACFPKDTQALCEYMKSYNSPSIILESVIEEKDAVRNLHTNKKVVNKCV